MTFLQHITLNFFFFCGVVLLTVGEKLFSFKDNSLHIMFSN